MGNAEFLEPLILISPSEVHCLQPENIHIKFSLKITALAFEYGVEP